MNLIHLHCEGTVVMLNQKLFGHQSINTADAKSSFEYPDCR